MIEIPESQHSLSMATSHILGVSIAHNSPMRVRRDQILAQSGLLEFWHETQETNRDIVESTKNRNETLAQRDAAFLKAVDRRVTPEIETGLLAGGNLLLHRASGEGEIYLGRNGGDITVFRVDDPGLVIFRQAEVLAYSDTLTATADKAVDKALATIIDATRAWTFSGSGELATATSGEVLLLQVTPEKPVLVEAEAILAMTSALTVSTPENYTSKLLQRTVSEVVKYLPYNIDLGRRKVWLVVHGEGQIVVRSSDLCP